MKIPSLCNNFVFFIMAMLGLNGLSSLEAEPRSGQASLNDGYSLFYDFCDQESQLSLLLWIKTTPPDIAEYAKKISTTAKEDMAMLKKFQDNDSSLRFNKVSLPPFELSVRKSMADDRKQQLIWGSSGVAFARAIRMTQSETTNYGFHVAKILAETEPNPKRSQAMQEIVKKWAALHLEAYNLSP